MNALTQQEIDRLLDLAEEARDHSYAPYLKYHVGAALLTADGQVYQGCNIENAAFTPTNCAERTAMFKAVSEGVRGFSAIAVAGGPAGDKTVYTAPCGVCRQVLAEFCRPDFRILLLEDDESIREFRLVELLPEIFLLEGAEAAR